MHVLWSWPFLIPYKGCESRIIGEESEQFATRELSLVIQQPALSLQSAAVADQRARGADHAVAGDENRDVISAIGGADGAAGAGPADGPGLLAIASGFAEPNRAKIFPDAKLEIGS